MARKAAATARYSGLDGAAVGNGDVVAAARPVRSGATPLRLSFAEQQHWLGRSNRACQVRSEAGGGGMPIASLHWNLRWPPPEPPAGGCCNREAQGLKPLAAAGPGRACGGPAAPCVARDQPTPASQRPPPGGQGRAQSIVPRGCRDPAELIRAPSYEARLSPFQRPGYGGQGMLSTPVGMGVVRRGQHRLGHGAKAGHPGLQVAGCRCSPCRVWPHSLGAGGQG